MNFLKHGISGIYDEKQLDDILIRARSLLNKLQTNNVEETPNEQIKKVTIKRDENYRAEPRLVNRKDNIDIPYFSSGDESILKERNNLQKINPLKLKLE